MSVAYVYSSPLSAANNKAAAASACVADVPAKAPAHNVSGKSESWKPNREAELLWAGDIDGKTASGLPNRLYRSFSESP